MARQNLLASILEERSTPDLAQPFEQSDGAHRSDRPFAAADRKATRPTPQLGMITQTMDVVSRAEEMERQLNLGHTIVELDPADLDSSFVPDRMAPSEEAHQDL